MADRETADSITTERLKYRQRVKVVGAAAPAVLRSEEALSVLGPSAFDLYGYYRPVEELSRHVSALSRAVTVTLRFAFSRP